ncbi:MAG TPA: hypothetical protein V6D47_11980 [Oscillatoriaceae cyanobacterium]
MKHRLPGIFAALLVLAPAPAWALDPNRYAIGYGLGISTLYQFSSDLDFRGHPLGPWSEGILGFDTRNQLLSPDKTYAIESAGLSYSLGAHLSIFRAGLSAEGDWLTRFTVADPAQKTLQFNYTGGFVLEPYFGIVLPFLNTPYTEVDLVLRWPLISPDPTIGPRLMLTTWAGAQQTQTTTSGDTGASSGDSQ